MPDPTLPLPPLGACPHFWASSKPNTDTTYNGGVWVCNGCGIDVVQNRLPDGSLNGLRPMAEASKSPYPNWPPKACSNCGTSGRWDYTSIKATCQNCLCKHRMISGHQPPPIKGCEAGQYAFTSDGNTWRWDGMMWNSQATVKDLLAGASISLSINGEKQKPDKSHGGYTVLVPCDKVPGGHHYQAVGIPDPEELICGHTFVNQKHSDGLVCTNPKCGMILSGTMIDALGPNRYDRERNRLADECGKLKSDNDELLRENAMLRRKVEKLQR